MDVLDFTISTLCCMAFCGVFYLTARALLRRIPSEQKQRWVRRQNQVMWFVGALIIGIVIGGISGHALEHGLSLDHGVAGALALGFGIATTMFFGSWMWSLLESGRL
jgi:hypothetical protein